MIVAPEVSFAVLRDLTNQRLKEIGVSLGHRRQLLREIANLDKMAAPSSSAPPPTHPRSRRRSHLTQRLPPSAAKSL
jgi:hypothetical protein